MSPDSPIVTLIFMLMGGLTVLICLAWYHRSHPIKISPEKKLRAWAVGGYTIAMAVLSLYFYFNHHELASRIVLTILPAGVLVLIGVRQ
jgi:hypothetical protein